MASGEEQESTRRGRRPHRLAVLLRARESLKDAKEKRRTRLGYSSTYTTYSTPQQCLWCDSLLSSGFRRAREMIAPVSETGLRCLHDVKQKKRLT